MGKRRTSTLSISLPPELAGAVSERVRSGLYTSASELIREALRLLLKMEEVQRAQLTHLAGSAPHSISASRFTTAMHLHDLGAAIRESKLRPGEQESAPSESIARPKEWEERQEVGPGLKISPERLAKLKLDE